MVSALTTSVVELAIGAFLVTKGSVAGSGWRSTLRGVVGSRVVSAVRRCGGSVSSRLVLVVVLLCGPVSLVVVSAPADAAVVPGQIVFARSSGIWITDASGANRFSSPTGGL